MGCATSSPDHDVHADRLHGRRRAHKNAGEALAFYQQIRMRYDPQLRLYLIAGYLSTHKDPSDPPHGRSARKPSWWSRRRGPGRFPPAGPPPTEATRGQCASRALSWSRVAVGLARVACGAMSVRVRGRRDTASSRPLEVLGVANAACVQGLHELA